MRCLSPWINTINHPIRIFFLWRSIKFSHVLFVVCYVWVITHLWIVDKIRVSDEQFDMWLFPRNFSVRPTKLYIWVLVKVWSLYDDSLSCGITFHVTARIFQISHPLFCFKSKYRFIDSFHCHCSPWNWEGRPSLLTKHEWSISFTRLCWRRNRPNSPAYVILQFGVLPLGNNPLKVPFPTRT